MIDINPKWTRTVPSLAYLLWHISRNSPPHVFFKNQSWYLIPCCGLEVQKPTQAHKSVKGPGNIADLNTKWSRTLPSLIYFSYDICRDPSPQLFFKYQSWYLTSCCEFEVQKPNQVLTSVKGSDYTFDLISKWKTTLPSLIYCSWNIYRDPLHNFFFKYQSWYLIPCYGFELQKPTQKHKSVKDPDNTFDLLSKWKRTTSSLIFVSWDIYRDRHPQFVFSNIRFVIWQPVVGLRCRNPLRNVCQLKAWEVPLT